MTRLQRMLLSGLVTSATIWLGIALFKPGPPPLDPARWATVEEPTVQVLFSGVPPRSVRAYQPTGGDRVDVVLSVRESASMTVGPQTLFEVEGAAELGVRTWVDAVEPDGTIAWRWVVRSAKVTDDRTEGSAPRDAWRTAVRGLEGLKGSSRLDPQGFVLESSSTVGGSAGVALQPEVERILREPVPHLPRAPIGERAEWSVTRIVMNDGVPTETVERWKLTEIKDDAWAFEATLKAEGEGAAPALPGLESAGALRQTSKGAGAWRLGLPRGLLLEGEGWIEVEGEIDPGFTGLPGMPGLTMLSHGAGEVAIHPAR